jgi:hypothetical protein
MRQAKEVARISWSSATLRKAFRAWWRRAARARAARAVSGAARLRALALALEAWRLGAAARRRKREVVHGAARRLDTGLVRKSWGAWRVSATAAAKTRAPDSSCGL